MSKLDRLRRAANRGPFDHSKYQAWRESVGFSDEQIAAGLEKLAAELPPNAHYMRNKYLDRAKRCREGRVSAADVATALPTVIEKCNVVEHGVECGKKALYRQGSQGRCRAHKHILEAFTKSRLLRFAARSEMIEKMQRERDRRDLERLHLHRTKTAGAKR